ncbi:MAG: hypothetical protein BGO76_03370 [Caedibacter sp. 38-128]|nr:hypothetical protein [Holosporales bacterium]OJX03889.1 MAG: hypothetical protein BGO76_03370 [Caedibacter sp. 38-128]
MYKIEVMKFFKSAFTFILVLSFFNGSILKGTENILLEEINSTTSSSVRRLLSDESMDDLATSTLSLEVNAVALNPDEERSNSLSNSYLLAFQDDLENKISRSEILKYIGCLVGGFGPFIPQIAVARKIAQSYNSEALGYILVGASALSIEAITAWIIWELIDDTKSLMKASKQDEGGTSTCNVNIVKNIGIGLSSFILGVLSSAPDVYIKYKYNTIKWFSLISLVYDSIPRVIGFYKLFSSLKLEKIKKLCKGKNIEELHGAKIVKFSKAYFLQKCKEDGIENVSEFLSGNLSPSEVYSYLTSNTQSALVDINSPHDFARGIPRKGVKYLSAILPVASATFNAVMAYKGFKVLMNNEPALWSLSTFSVMPAFFLGSYVVMEASGNVFDKIYLCRSQVPSSDYFSHFYPKINLVLLGTALVLASTTSFGTFFLVTDNLKDTILDPLKYGIAALAVGADVTFGTYTIYSTFKRYGEVICKKFSKGASYVLNCSEKLSDLSDSFVNFSSNLISNFVNDVTLEDELVL